MKRLCIIPARGGSKRIERKNIKPFLGKPIISYSIKAALESGLFDEVMVSTDDMEIATIAKESGALVPFMRSTEAANDTATTAEVILEVLDQYHKTGKEFDYACCLYPTAPLIQIKYLKEAYDILVKENRTTVFPVTKFSFPILRSLKITNGRLEMNWPEHLLTRSQDLPDAYHDAGQFYWLNTKGFLEDPRLVTENTAGVTLSELEVQDIDNLLDWEMAEMKYAFLNRNKIKN